MNVNVTFQENDTNIVVVLTENDANIEVELTESNESFETKLGVIHTVTEYVGGTPYELEYAVTPKVDAQTLPTKERVMLDDVTILAIPYYETSNNSGGDTVYIAKEI